MNATAYYDNGIYYLTIPISESEDVYIGEEWDKVVDQINEVLTEHPGGTFDDFFNVIEIVENTTLMSHS